MEARAGFHGPGALSVGFTIEHSVTLYYTAKDGITYQLNFIDTPVTLTSPMKSAVPLAACEGALLVVDAGQGVGNQSVANCYRYRARP